MPQVELRISTRGESLQDSFHLVIWILFSESEIGSGHYALQTLVLWPLHQENTKFFVEFVENSIPTIEDSIML